MPEPPTSLPDRERQGNRQVASERRSETSTALWLELIESSAFDSLRTLAQSEMIILMTDVDRQWSLSNPGPDKLLVWLEPWAEEFEVPARSHVALSVPGGTEEDMLFDVEWTPNHLVVWAGAPGTVNVYVDGALQDSASALVSIPKGLTKQTLNIVFAGQPAARLGGRTSDATERTSWWQRGRRRLGW